MFILFESQIYPDSLLNEFEFKSKGILDYAAHNLSKSILEGLKQNNQTIMAVNTPNLGSYPLLYKSLFVKGAILDDGVSIPFINLSYLKRFDIRRRLRKEMQKQIKAYSKDGEICLLLYNFRCLPFIDILKNSCPQLKVCMVVTDLPEFMLKPKSRILLLFGKLLKTKRTMDQNSLKAIDGFVLLAPEMVSRLGITNKPWIQIEGIYNSDTKIEDREKEPLKTILYTGNLGLRYGIGTLLEAFHRISGEDYRLWICGGGEGLDEVKRYCELDRRIIYKGILSRAEVIRLQKKATVLINPRNSGDDYTRYSFPSKTMEYLASGTPVIMSHLASIPKEYDAHIYYVEDESIDGYKNKIMEICNKSTEELRTFGELASRFISENKSPMPQMTKVIDFIKSLY